MDIAVFAGLEWGTFQNFESQSLVAASVIILLPIGTLIAQQISARSFAGPGPDYSLCTRSDCSCACHHSTRGDTVTATGGKTMRTGGTAATRTADSDGDQDRSKTRRVARHQRVERERLERHHRKERRRAKESDINRRRVANHQVKERKRLQEHQAQERRRLNQ